MIQIFPARCVHNREGEAQQRGIAEAAIAGDTGLVVDERELLADQPVEQRRFADVGTPDNDNLRKHRAAVAPTTPERKRVCCAAQRLSQR